jgi:UPF0755 protein
MENDIDKIEQKKSKSKNWTLNIILVIGFMAIFAYYFLSAPFGNKDVVIHISSGEQANTIYSQLENNNTVRHSLALKIFVKILKRKSGLVTGDYLIKKSSPVWVVAWQIGRGHHNIQPIKVTIREGLTNEEIATLLADKLAGFRRDLFLTEVEGKQGYLFPDTYFFYPLDTGPEIVEKLSNNFEVRIKDVSIEIKNSNKKLSEIITMASILEGEAGGDKDISTISGILWKRISLGMPLQVDIDKNTYTNKGLPPKPLNNPGLASIRAAINPESSPYLYYLHEKNGNVHYAVSFDEHKHNISKYLK